MNIKQIRQNSIIAGRPFLTFSRWLKWVVHCTIRVPALVNFENTKSRLYLLPRLKRFGSTSIFIKREYYEPELLGIRPFIERDKLVLDIGGSFGVYTIFMQEFVGQNGRVITFEPGNLSFSILQKNIALNDMPNVRIEKLALSDSAGEASLFHIADSPVNFSLGGESGHQSEKVKTARLDDILTDAEVDLLNFIKIDVEGYESKVFLGARKAIARAKPTIMFEVSHSAILRAGRPIDEAYSILEKLDYQFYRLHDGSYFSCTAPTEGNIFAIHVTKIDQFPALNGFAFH